MHEGRAIKQARKDYGLTQQQLANQLPGISRETISKYENSENIPFDSLKDIVSFFDDYKLNLKLLGRAIPCCFLSKTDKSPLATVTKAIELMERDLHNLKRVQVMLINKNDDDDLTEKEREMLITECMIPFQKVNICMDHSLGSLAVNYNINLFDEVLEPLLNELLEKGYIDEENAEAVYEMAGKAI
ncbi:MAG: helix-turn-helix domain-containing protein [Bacteroidota bacterium]